MTVTGSQLIRILKHQGFVVQRQKGSHVRPQGPQGQHVTVPVHGSRVLPSGTLVAILREAGLTVQDLENSFPCCSAA